MRQLKTILFATALCLGTFSFAQAQKIAHINTQELVQAMPETKSAQSELQALSKTYQTDMQSSVTEFQNLLKQYESEAPTKTEEENAKRSQEIQEKQKRLQQFQADAQKDLQKKERDLMKPITDKAKAAIEKVADAQGFDYVLDSSVGVIIVANGKDLLNDVKKELGI